MPFICYCLLQIPVGVVGLLLVRDETLRIGGALRAWIFGQMILFAVFQLMAVPMILARIHFDVLFWSYAIIFVALFFLGSLRIRNVRLFSSYDGKMTPLAVLLLIAALILIAIQLYKYVFMMHLDEDDARWLAEANDALEYGNMLTRSFDTGEYEGLLVMAKDVTSPLPMLFAILTRLLGTRVAVFAHTIYAPVELLLMYAVYWCMGSELFEKDESKGAFLLCVAAANLYLGNSVYTQSVFALSRIWQGKATVAAVTIPLLLYMFLNINRTDDITMWLRLPIACCSACLMSGMGISLSAIMILVYGACSCILYRRWWRVPYVLLSVAPSVTYLAVYTMFRTLYYGL